MTIVIRLASLTLMAVAVACGDDTEASTTSSSWSASSAASGSSASTASSASVASASTTGGSGGAGGEGQGGAAAGGAATAPERLVLTGSAEGTSEDGTEIVTCLLGGELIDIELTA